MNKNKASIILSGISILGVATTGFLAAKRSELQKILKNEALKKNSNLTKKDEFIIFVKAQWPALLSGSATSACIIGAQVLDMKEIAAVSSIAMAATYKYNDAMNYIKEKYPDTYKEVKSYVNGESAKRAIESNPKIKEETYDGRERFYEPWTNQIFYANRVDVLEALDETKKRLINGGSASIYDFLKSLPPSVDVRIEPWMEHFGWYTGAAEETMYEYNAGHFGLYLSHAISNETITFNGDEIQVNVIDFECQPDIEPDMPASIELNVEAGLEEALNGGITAK